MNAERFFNLKQIHPSQPDDGRETGGDNAILVYWDPRKEMYVILDGNHRYYRRLREQGPDGEIRAIVKGFPY